MSDPIPNETTECIRNALRAGRVLDAVRLYREATSASLVDAKAFVDQLEVGSVTMSDAAGPTETPALSLADHGWLVEQTDDGGVRLRMSGRCRGVMIGASMTAALLLIFAVVIGLWFLRDTIWNAFAVGGEWQVVPMLLPMAFVGLMALSFAGFLWQALRLALWREEWEATRNSLIVRRGWLRSRHSRELTGGELLLEPHIEGTNAQTWRLAVVCDGEKRYLLRESKNRFGFRETHSLAETAAMADLLAEHTGWPVSRSSIVIDGDWKPPAESNDEELLAALRSHQFVAELDEQSRWTIHPTMIDQRIGGLALLAIGVVWMWYATGSVVSFLNNARSNPQSALDLFCFWLMMVPILMLGAGVCILALIVCFRRVRWIVEHNLLLVCSSVFGWDFEHEYVNAHWKLAKIHRKDAEQRRESFWELQIENQSGNVLKVLHKANDDDIPRLLGTLLSQRTGWPLSESGS